MALFRNLLCSQFHWMGCLRGVVLEEVQPYKPTFGNFRNPISEHLPPCTHHVGKHSSHFKTTTSPDVAALFRRAFLIHARQAFGLNPDPCSPCSLLPVLNRRPPSCSRSRESFD